MPRRSKIVFLVATIAIGIRAKVSAVEFLANSVAGFFYVIFWIQLVGLFIERHALAILALLGTPFSGMDFPYYFIGAFAGFLVLCRV